MMPQRTEGAAPGLIPGHPSSVGADGGIGLHWNPVVSFWVWYGFVVRTLIRNTPKGTTLKGLGKG